MTGSSDAPTGGHVEAARRLAAALRLLGQRSVATDAPAEELHAVAEAVEGAAARLEPFQLQSRLERDGIEAILETHPIRGASSFLAPPVTVEAGPSGAIGAVVFGAAYEGAPGRVHGGYVAAAFDVVLGAAVAAAGMAGFTGTLTVRYLKPTPLFTTLRYEAQVVRTEGRKIYARAVLHAGDLLTGEAEGVFVSADVLGAAGLRSAFPPQE